MTRSDDPRGESRQRRLRPGIRMLVISLLLAAGSLGLFCYALDLNLADSQGTLDDRQPVIKRIPLAIAMLGFGVSILFFWSGYLSLARR